MARKLEGKPHEPQKISFKYLHYRIDDLHSSVDARKGTTRIVSPFHLILNDGYYYLLAFDDQHKEIRPFRVDRMKEVKLLNEPREGADAFAEIDMSQYARRVFGMFGGEKHRVTLRFTNDLLDDLRSEDVKRCLKVKVQIRKIPIIVEKRTAKISLYKQFRWHLTEFV